MRSWGVTNMALNELIQREQDERVRALTHTPTFLVVAGSRITLVVIVLCRTF